MSIFSYCPNCGSQKISFPNNVRFHCSDCDFVYFHNIAAAVAVILRYEDELLFTVRNQDPDKGKWDLPGGFIDPKENAEQAACRELNEELGLELQPKDLRYLTTHPNNYNYRNVPYRTMDIFYEAQLSSKDQKITAEDEIQNLVWVKLSEVDLEKIGFTSIRNVVREYIAE